ncbi:MAG: YihY/virulence factor BrkB family protein [Streptosporangiaceae bacterium]
MNALKKLIAKLDRLQQSQPWLAFPVAVWKKFGDDQAGNLAALIAYYGFASLFPLLLVFVTVLNIVLAHDTSLRVHVLNSAFSHFPVIGEQLKTNASNHTLHGSAPALIIGLILTFFGARGVAAAAQNALNTVWGVPLSRRAGFPWSLLKQLGLIVGVGIGLLATTLLSGLAGASASSLGGTAAQIGTVAVSLVLNVGVFWLGFRLAVQPEIKARQMLPSAVLSAIVWQILQLLGTYLVTHTISKSSSTYGVFAVVLGLLAWLYLQAQLTLYAVEANVVSVLRLWPRSLAPPPLTAEDRRAYAMYAQIQERRPEQEVESRITEEPDSTPRDSTPKDSAPKDGTSKDGAPNDTTPNGSTSTGRAPAP